MNRTLLLSFGTLCALTACQVYEPKPLVPVDVLALLEGERRAEEPSSINLATATQHLLQRNLKIRAALAEYEVLQAKVEIPTPLPNPTILAGPSLLSGPGVSSATRLGIDSSLGWAIPLSGRLGLRDDVSEMEAESALVHAVGTQREEWLSVRHDFASLALTEQRLAAQRALVESAAKAVDVQKTMLRAQATAIDVRFVELEHANAEAAVFTALESRADLLGRLAQRCGVPQLSFAALSRQVLPGLPVGPPAVDVLTDLLLEAPEFLRLRSEYLVSERQLRLEIARQYPDLVLAGGYEREGSVDKFSLGIGIELPLFDRNQQAIAQARATREGIRSRYTASLRERIAAITAARNRLLLRIERLAHMQKRVVPLTAELQDLGVRMVAAGGLDTMRLLVIIRTQRAARLDEIAAEINVFESWAELEGLCGAPLLAFPGELSLAKAVEVKR